MKNKTLGKGGFTAAVIMTAAFCALSYFLWPLPQTEGRFGICLDSPNLWTLNRISSWIINTVLIFGSALGMAFLNRSFSFVRSTDYVMSSTFMVMTAANPLLNTHLNTSVIMAAVCVLGYAIMFSAYKKPNATTEMFLMATMLSWCSMFQYSFILLAPAFLGVAAVMHCLRFKETVAFLLGVIAPYWITVGLGVIPLSAFSLPDFTTVFSGYNAGRGVFLQLLSLGVIALVTFMLALNNGMKLYAGNSQVRAMNNAINIVTFVSFICMIFDYRNITAYMATFYLGASVQIADFFALFRIRKGWIYLFILAILLTVFYFCSI